VITPSDRVEDGGPYPGLPWPIRPGHTVVAKSGGIANAFAGVLHLPTPTLAIIPMISASAVLFIAQLL
jgi:hypothetical protein